MKQANLSENDLNDMTKQLETIVKDMANNIDLSSIDPSSFTSDDSTNFEDNPTPQFSAIPLGSIFSNMFGENAEGAQESSSDRKKVKVDKKVAKKIAEKQTPAGKLRDLSESEIQTKINELKQELFNLRFQAEVGKLENTAQLKKVKKEIARCYTVLTERTSK